MTSAQMSTPQTASPAAALDAPPPLRKRPRSRWSPLISTLRYLALAALACFFLLPVYAMVITSMKSPAEATVSNMWKLPRHFDFGTFGTVWHVLQQGMVNSLILAVSVSVLSSALGAANGFVLSKWRFPGSDVVFPLILFGMFIPYQAILKPMFQTLLQFHLVGGLDGLILVHTIYGLPITTLIFRSYFSTISDEIIEAAQVDGAGMLRTFFHVALPIAPPAFAVSMIWQFTSSWNDFLFSVLLTKSQFSPVIVVLQNNFAGGQTVLFNQTMASALVASLPTLLIYILLGRFFMRGLMAGALKG
jgi:glucose/mannose transport system permease protein